MLDTNTVSHLIRLHPLVTQRLLSLPMNQVCISAVVEGELMFGVAKRPEAKRLATTVSEFLLRVDVLPWDSDVAKVYGTLRASAQSMGVSLEPLDMMIAAHAKSHGAILVTNDAAFGKLDAVFGKLRMIEVEDWTQ